MAVVAWRTLHPRITLMIGKATCSVLLMHYCLSIVVFVVSSAQK